MILRVSSTPPVFYNFRIYSKPFDCISYQRVHIFQNKIELWILSQRQKDPRNSRQSMKDGIRDGRNQLCPKPGVIIRNILLLALQEQIDPRARSRMGERRGRDSDANYARVRDMYRDASRPVEDEYIRTCIPALMLHSQRATMSSQVLRILEKVKTSDQNPTFELSASYLSFLYYILCCDVFSLSMTCFPALKETHAAPT